MMLRSDSSGFAQGWSSWLCEASIVCKQLGRLHEPNNFEVLFWASSLGGHMNTHCYCSEPSMVCMPPGRPQTFSV